MKCCIDTIWTAATSTCTIIEILAIVIDLAIAIVIVIVITLVVSKIVVKVVSSATLTLTT